MLVRTHWPFARMSLYMGVFSFVLFLFFLIAPGQIPGRNWEFVLLILSGAALFLGLHAALLYEKDRWLAIIGLVLGASPFLYAFFWMASRIGPASVS